MIPKLEIDTNKLRDCDPRPQAEWTTFEIQREIIGYYIWIKSENWIKKLPTNYRQYIINSLNEILLGYIFIKKTDNKKENIPENRQEQYSIEATFNTILRLEVDSKWEEMSFLLIKGRDEKYRSLISSRSRNRYFVRDINCSPIRIETFHQKKHFSSFTDYPIQKAFGWKYDCHKWNEILENRPYN